MARHTFDNVNVSIIMALRVAAARTWTAVAPNTRTATCKLIERCAEHLRNVSRNEHVANAMPAHNLQLGEAAIIRELSIRAGGPLMHTWTRQGLQDWDRDDVTIPVTTVKGAGHSGCQRRSEQRCDYAKVINLTPYLVYTL